ncbi:MAG: hypothetical protein J5983_04735 [Ruminococcus sp.]|nr:hypothetical protein [Ruminococcus sp.]
MHVKNFVICDPQKKYSMKLLRTFRTKNQRAYQYYLFHALDDMENCMAKKRIHILLISEEFSKRLRDDITVEKKLVLTDQNRKVRGERVIFRYQSAEDIWLQVQKEAVRRKVSAPKKAAKGEGELIAVYSPVHRIGKTTFALELGRRLAEKEPVLYLNLEEYSGGDYYFPEKQKQNLGDLLYYLRQEKGNLGMRISVMAGQYEGLDFIMPMTCVQDLRAVKGEEWVMLFERILKECIYEKVILDLGDSIDGIYQILKKCTSIYMPYIEEPAAAAKMRQYTDNIRRMGMEEILEKTIQKRMESKPKERDI